MVDKIKATDAQGNTVNDTEPVRAAEHRGPADGSTDAGTFARPPMPTDAPANTAPGAVAGETVQVEAIVEFMNDNVKRRVGDKFEMPVDRAIAAGRFVRAIGKDGKHISVRAAVGDRGLQGSAADMSGRPRHERLDTLRQEEQRLKERLQAVQDAIAKEEASAKADAPKSEPVKEAEPK